MYGCNRYLIAAAALFAVAANAAAFGQSSGGKSVWDSVYSDAQSKRGEEVSKKGCVSCHGEGLAGSDLAPALQGEDFRAAWAGRTAGELFDKIQTTMPADQAGSLKPQQSADLVAYMFKLNEYPAGTTELASEMAALQQIKITGKK
jgi:quinoprotein glucose dehydrogenase